MVRTGRKASIFGTLRESMKNASRKGSFLLSPTRKGSIFNLNSPFRRESKGNVFFSGSTKDPTVGPSGAPLVPEGSFWNTSIFGNGQGVNVIIPSSPQVLQKTRRNPVSRSFLTPFLRTPSLPPFLPQTLRFLFLTETFHIWISAEIDYGGWRTWSWIVW